MGKPRPPKEQIPNQADTAKILKLLKSIDARLSRLEDDDDRRAAKAAQMLANRQP